MLDLGSDPSLGEALDSARTTGQARLSAPVRLPGDGRIGVFAFVPVFAKGLPLRTATQRRDALTGLVAGADRRERARFASPRPDSPTTSTCASPTARSVLCPGPGGSAIASRRARRPDLARLARPRFRLSGRADRHRLRGRWR